MKNENALALELTQSEANIALLALELYEQAMSLSGQTTSSKMAKELWDKVFNEGLEAFCD